MIFRSRNYPRNITIGGQEYDLSIFRPIQRRFMVNSRNINVKFEFSTHIFSEKSNENQHNVFDDTGHFNSNNHRIFDSLRYENAVNHLIPFIKERLDADWVLFPTNRNNHFCCIRRDYHIYFKFRQMSNYTQVIITSAFNKSPRQGYMRGRDRQIISYTFGDLIRIE